jgi:hypothetical protein
MPKFLTSFSDRLATTGAILTLSAAAFAAAVIAQSPAEAQAKRPMDVTFANITNATIKVTAKDLNDGGKTIASEEELKHNEQITRKMMPDKDGNGRVSYSAHTTESDSKLRKCKSFEGKQLSNGFTFSITADKSC